MKTHKKHFNCNPIFLLATVVVLAMGVGDSFATDYTGTWTSVTPSNSTLGALANYTLVSTNPTSTGAATANSYVASGKTVVITFPTGFTLTTITGGTLNATALGTITKTATTVSFATPVAIAKGAVITIVLNNITNNSVAACYPLSMTIDNATGTGAGFQNLFPTGLNSSFGLGGANCYCTSAATNAADEDILNVTFNDLNNTSTCATTGGAGSILNRYSNFTAFTANVTQGLTYSFSVQVGTCGGAFGNGVKIFIDFNNNGVLNDAGEQVYVSPAVTTGPHTETGTITIPCTAAVGNTRMRVISVEGTIATVTAVTPCSTYSWGETEDYTVNIAAGSNMAYSSSTTTQNISAVAVNTTNNQIIGVQVVTTGACNPFDASSFTFVTTGSTSVADITNAKLFYTGNSNVFATTTQLGATVASPPASPTTFTISGFSQVLAGGTDYFWLSYDIPAGATVGNVVDAECSSLIVNAISRTPLVTAPTGNRPIVGPPAAYCSITGASGSATPPYVTNVTLNTFNNTTVQTGSPTYYNDYYPTISTTVEVNGLYSLSADANVAVAGCCFETTYLQVFIDLNNDGDFSDAGETVAQENGIGATGDRFVHIKTAVSFWGATAGITRMRVVASTGGYFGPCGTSTDAEIEDYKIYVDVLAASCSNTVLDGSETTTDCGGSTCGPFANIAMSPASPASVACGSGTYTLTASNAKGSAIQWQYSRDNLTWYDISGATALTYSGTANTTSYFRAKVTGGTCAVFYTSSVSITITGTSSATWLTTGTSAWATATNWSTGVVPTSCTDVTIPSGGTQPTVSTAGASCRNLTINSGAILTNSTTTFNIYGNLLNDGNLNDAVGYTNLEGGGNTWGGTGTFMNGATQAGNVNISDGANYILTSNQTVDRLHPINTASTGHLSFGSYTMTIKTIWYCAFYTHFNTGMMDLQGGGSIDPGKSDYGTGVLWVNSSVNNFGFNLEDDYYSVWFNNSAGATKFGSAAKDVWIKQDLWIRNPGTLDLSTSGSNAIVVGHDFINDAVMIASTSFIRMQDFNVAQIQNITSTNGTVTAFNGLEINNSGPGVYLQLDANTNNTATGTLKMTAGPLYLNSHTFIVQNAALGGITRTGGRVVSETNAAVNPSILQWNIGTVTGAHVYPFGTAAGDYLPVTFNNSGAVGKISISTHPTLSDNISIAGASNVAAVSSMACPLDATGCELESVIDRWWDITSTLASPLPAVTLSLTYSGSENTTTATGNVGFQHWTGTLWNDGKGGAASTFTDAGVLPVTSGTQTVTGTGFTQFSPYILMRGGPGAPLPVKLLSFDALPDKDHVIVNWTTETEINNDYFTVERSKDLKNFEVIDVVKSKNGNSNVTQRYDLTDKNPLKGTSYYRLKQTDYDGHFEYFEPVAVTIKNTFGGVTVYPNPVTGNSFIEFISDQETAQNISIYDIAGRVVYKKLYPIKKGENKLVLETTHLSKGMYFVQLVEGTDGVNIKFIKE